jgi:hypothetical protein
MPYAPTVNDRSGEILGEYTANAANIRAQGMANMGQSIGEGLQSMGSSIAGGITKAGENKMTSEYLDSLAGQYSQTPGMDGKTPLMSQDELDKFSKMSLGAKQGMIVPKQAQFDQILKNQYLAAQIQGFGQRQSMQNQVPVNQQPYPAPAAQPQANPVGGINMNFVTEPKQQQ